jgi:hypothetical protein
MTNEGVESDKEFNKRATQKELRAIIDKHDHRLTEGETVQGVNTGDLEVELAKYFADSREFVGSVLGIDIYRYSKFKREKQRLIPSIFKKLFDDAVGYCGEHEPFLFQKNQFSDRFISTGDGGFLIFDTPLHALVFATWFQACLAVFNSGLESPRLRKFVGALELRYTLTLDELFVQDSVHYGAAIINNARILSRDSLNRFLLDGHTVAWFATRLRTFETIMGLTIADIASLPDFKSYDRTNLKSVLFMDAAGDSPGQGSIRTAIVQKIGETTAKDDKFDTYSAYMQFGLSYGDGETTPMKNIVVTLGNLNSSGLAV